jgi:hypothetical protein
MLKILAALPGTAYTSSLLLYACRQKQYMRLLILTEQCFCFPIQHRYRISNHLPEVYKYDLEIFRRPHIIHLFM